MSLEIKANSLRLRKKNLSRNEEATGKEFREVQVDKSCHKVRESLLSSTSFSNMFNSGISNMCLVIFILSNGSLAFENIGKYGILINPFVWIKIYFCKLTEMSPVLILSGLNIFSLSSLGLEILCSKGILNDAIHLVLVVLFLMVEISAPLFVLRYIDSFANMESKQDVLKWLIFILFLPCSFSGSASYLKNMIRD